MVVEYSVDCQSVVTEVKILECLSDILVELIKHQEVERLGFYELVEIGFIGRREEEVHVMTVNQSDVSEHVCKLAVWYIEFVDDCEVVSQLSWEVLSAEDAFNQGVDGQIELSDVAGLVSL